MVQNKAHWKRDNDIHEREYVEVGNISPIWSMQNWTLLLRKSAHEKNASEEQVLNF